MLSEPNYEITVVEPLASLESDQLTKSLFSGYNASYGGKYEIVGPIDRLDELVNAGYVTVAECRKDPLSLHNAKSCRVLLVRLTEKGISEAQKVVEHKTENVGHILRSIDELPARLSNYCRYLLKLWLNSCEKDLPFDWTVPANVPFRLTASLFPEEVSVSIAELCSELTEQSLASLVPIHHKTSGPMDETLMTCPEIRDLINRGTGFLEEKYCARGVKTAQLDEYLSYLFNGLALMGAKAHLIQIADSNNKLEFSWVMSIARRFGVPGNVLWSWLYELEGYGYFGKEIIRSGIQSDPSLSLPHNCDEDVVFYGSASYYYNASRENQERIAREVQAKIKKWFETGEEKFQHFDLTRSRE